MQNQRQSMNRVNSIGKMSTVDSNSTLSSVNMTRPILRQGEGTIGVNLLVNIGSYMSCQLI